MSGIRLIGAPTNLGLKPYEGGGPRHVDETPGLLRRLGLVEALGAEDGGDVPGGTFLDLAPVPGGIRNGAAITDHAVRLAHAVAATPADARTLVLGGDCSVLLGCLAGVTAAERMGLIYIDAHCDFATPAISHSNAAAGMVLALATGRIDHPLARLHGRSALVRDEHIVVLGRRDFADEVFYAEASIRNTPIMDVPWDEVERIGVAEAARRAVAHLSAGGVDGFWIHVDTDVLDPEFVSAVDSPEPGGPTPDDAVLLLRTLWSAPSARGIDVTIYDPYLDPTGEQARTLTDLLARSLSLRTEAPTDALDAP